MSMGGSVVSNKDVSHLDDAFLDSSGRMKALFPSSDFHRGVSREDLRLWCHKRARYIVPTLELVLFLRGLIDNKSAIEIASGNGDLGYLLGIPETDSYLQTRPAILAYYRLMGQVPNSPPKGVVQMEGNEAATHYRPQVIIGAWVTQKHRPGDAEGNMYGVDEELILDQGFTYIHVGNEAIHGGKCIRSRNHEVYRIEGHVSRAQTQSLNVIYVWRP